MTAIVYVSFSKPTTFPVMIRYYCNNIKSWVQQVVIGSEYSLLASNKLKKRPP